MNPTKQPDCPDFYYGSGCSIDCRMNDVGPNHIFYEHVQHMCRLKITSGTGRAANGWNNYGVDAPVTRLQMARHLATTHSFIYLG